jgi:phosphinothricin acetyltransferase
MAVTDLIGVRAAGVADLPGLNEIYAYYVRETPVSFDLEPPSEADRAGWLAAHATTGPYRIVVAADGGTDAVVGYAASSRFRARAAYRSSVETSVYLDPGWVGRGLGARLYGALFDALAECGLHRAYAAVTLPNPGSVALHERFGFREIGVLDEAGHKFGQYWSVLLLERRF